MWDVDQGGWVDSIKSTSFGLRFATLKEAFESKDSAHPYKLKKVHLWVVSCKTWQMRTICVLDESSHLVGPEFAMYLAMQEILI